jgi:cation diffusion facilitator family transporter
MVRGTKSRAATISIVSNALLIALKIAAAAITGSIAILTEAIHSSIDLVASVIALVSVRKADAPPDPEHPYGHEKAENLAAAIEGILILLGAGIIIYEATHRLVAGAEIERLGVGLAVIGASAVVNIGVSAYLARRAKALRSAALEGDAAHLRTDALTSIGVFAGLGLVAITGSDVFDSIAALVVAVAIVGAGLRILTRSSRVLMDEAPPPQELDRPRGDGRLPQAPRPARGRPPLHRHARAVPRRDDARRRALVGRPAARRDRGRDPGLRGAHPRRAGGVEARPGGARYQALPRWLEEIDGCGQAHRGDHDGVADVAVDGQDHGGDHADRDHGQPGGSLKRHGYMLTT